MHFAWAVFFVRSINDEHIAMKVCMDCVVISIPIGGLKGHIYFCIIKLLKITLNYFKLRNIERLDRWNILNVK